MNRIQFSLFIGILLSLSSCKKEEIPIPKHVRGEVKSTQIFLESDYKYQVWYDFGSNSEMGRNLRSEWDLSFSCSPSQNIVYLNSSRLMRAALVKDKNFEDELLINGLDFHADHPGRNLDSLAVGNRLESSNFYVLDLGYDPNGKTLGYIKFQVYFSNNAYRIRTANLNGQNVVESEVVKDYEYNRMYFSIQKNASIFIEPKKDLYDLCFTQYTYFFEVPYLPYLVMGVLLNENKVQVAVDSTHTFAEINSSLLSNYSYSDSLDAIGYDWKVFNFSSSIYTVRPSKNYILKDTEGFYYKLHFTDFYNAKGEKGNPKFEFQKL